MVSKSSTSDDRVDTAIDSLSKRMDRMRQRLEEMLARMDGAPAPIALAAPAPSALVFSTSPAMSETPAAAPTIASASIDTTTPSPATTRELLPTAPARCSTPGGSHGEHVLAPVVVASPVPSSPTVAAAATTGVVITNTPTSIDAGLTVEEPTSSTKQVYSKLMVTPSTSSPSQRVPSSSSVEVSSKSSNSSTGAQKVFDEMVPQQAVFIGVALDTMKHNHITVPSTAVDSMVDGSTKEKGDYMLQDVLRVRDHRIDKASVKRLRYHKKFKHCASYMLDTHSCNCSIMFVLDEFLAVQAPAESLLEKSEQPLAGSMFEHTTHARPALAFGASSGCFGIDASVLFLSNTITSRPLQMSTGDHRVFDRGKHIQSASWPLHSIRTAVPNGDHKVFDRGKGIQPAELLLNGVLYSHMELMVDSLTLKIVGWVHGIQWKDIRLSQFKVGLYVFLQKMNMHFSIIDARDTFHQVCEKKDIIPKPPWPLTKLESEAHGDGKYVSASLELPDGCDIVWLHNGVPIPEKMLQKSTDLVSRTPENSLATSVQLLANNKSDCVAPIKCSTQFKQVLFRVVAEALATPVLLLLGTISSMNLQISNDGRMVFDRGKCMASVVFMSPIGKVSRIQVGFRLHILGDSWLEWWSPSIHEKLFRMLFTAEITQFQDQQMLRPLLSYHQCVVLLMLFPCPSFDDYQYEQGTAGLLSQGPSNSKLKWSVTPNKL
ncbi:unnamed protein product [Urochloa humidicola]